MPERIQLRRTPGWTLADQSDNAVAVTGPGPWANPYTATMLREHIEHAHDLDRGDQVVQTVKAAHHLATQAFAMDLCLGPRSPWWWHTTREHMARITSQLRDGQLRGRDLACWCPRPRPGDPDVCHAAVLLAHANPPKRPSLTIDHPHPLHDEDLASWESHEFAAPPNPGPPSPGPVALVAVCDYYGDELMREFTLTWEGWTADQVIANRIKRWKNARTRYQRDGNLLTYWSADQRWQQLTITDHGCGGEVAITDRDASQRQRSAERRAASKARA